MYLAHNTIIWVERAGVKHETAGTRKTKSPGHPHPAIE